MPRQSKPWYREASGTWVSRVGGRLHTLAHGKANLSQARRNLRDLLVRPLEDEGLAKQHVPLSKLVEEFLEDCERRLCHRSRCRYRWHLSRFLAHCGDRPAGDVRGVHCLAWVDAAGWGVSTRRIGIKSCKRLFRWAVEVGHLAYSPLDRLHVPEARRRDDIPAAADVEAFLQECPHGLRDIAEVLALTGARPCEIQAARAGDFLPGEAVIKLASHKTALKVGKPRIIYLPGRALAIVRRRCRGRGPGDLIFTNSVGGPWRGLARAFLDVRARAGSPACLTPYSLRHFRATEWLRLGVPVAHVSELLGHASTAMVSKHYSHLSKHSAELRRSANVA